MNLTFPMRIPNEEPEPKPDRKDPKYCIFIHKNCTFADNQPPVFTCEAKSDAEMPCRNK